MELTSWLALGCPDCPTGRDARSLVLGDGFFPHLVAMLAPFLLVLGLVALALRGRGKPW